MITETTNQLFDIGSNNLPIIVIAMTSYICGILSALVYFFGMKFNKSNKIKSIILISITIFLHLLTIVIIISTFKYYIIIPIR